MSLLRVSLPRALVALACAAMAACGNAGPSVVDAGPDAPAASLEKWQAMRTTRGANHFEVLEPNVLIEALLGDLSAVSGLGRKAPVPMVEIASFEGSEQIQALIAAEESLPELQHLSHNAAAALAALGLDEVLTWGDDEPEALPDDDDGVADPFAGEILGLYDTMDKVFFVLADAPPGERAQVMRHELMHALQDQHFDLHQQLWRRLGDFDALMAFRATVEGQAEVAAQRAEQARSHHLTLMPKRRLSAKRAPPSMQRSSVGGRRLHGRHRDALPFLALPAHAASLDAVVDADALDFAMFPYVAGTQFFQQLMLGGAFYGMTFADWVQETFAHPPQGTRHILHPYDYLLERRQPPRPPLSVAAFEAVPEHPLAWQSPLGELVAKAYLFQHGGEASLAHDLLRDRVAVLEQPSSTLPVVAWVSEWRHEAAATAFAAEAKAIQDEMGRRRRLRGITPGQTFVSTSGTRVGMMMEVARDNGHPRADAEHQHLLARALDEALQQGSATSASAP